MGPFTPKRCMQTSKQKNKNPKTTKKYKTKKWSGFKKIEIFYPRRL